MVGVEAEVRHVTDYKDIAAKGVTNTPGLIIHGVLVSTGRVPSAGDIAAWLAEQESGATQVRAAHGPAGTLTGHPQWPGEL